jgi:hypothetical protein
VLRLAVDELLHHRAQLLIVFPYCNLVVWGFGGLVVWGVGGLVFLSFGRLGGGRLLKRKGTKIMHQRT